MYSAQASHLSSIREGAALAHNMFLSVQSELGIVGLVLFTGTLLLAVRMALGTAGRGSSLALGIVLGLGAFVVAGMALSWEYQKIGFVLYGSALSLCLGASSGPEATSTGTGDRGAYRT
jgi:O-antigen ligase